MMFAFAALVIHTYVFPLTHSQSSYLPILTPSIAYRITNLNGCQFRVFRTSHTNTEINETSSYIDLAPLYGTDQAMQDKVRTRNGRGTLHPDTFAEDRLLLLPPAVCVLLVLFNRNHNVRLSFL